MSKFNTGARAAVFSQVLTESVPSGQTYEGAAGYKRDVKGELFLLAVSNMVGENTFYEKAGERDTRYADLVREATAQDPEWTARLLKWLRTEANMRTASLVGAAEFAKARLNAQQAGMSRQVIDSVLQRADEPGEFLAYWTSTYGRALPKPVKRGVADAVNRLYNERSLIKWDSAARSFRFGDVIDLVHPTASADWQGDLFKYALDLRHGRAKDDAIPVSLRTIDARAELMALLVSERRAVLADPARLAAAGMTWESLAGWLQGPMDSQAWEAVIPSMGYMALARNLRNFDEAGVSDEVAEKVAAKLADPDQVARSRQFPFRFWAAFKHAPSLRWGHALEKALKLSLSNVPSLSGRTLILVDRSPSMFPGFFYSTPNKSDIPLAEQAALFGSALALRAQNATLVEFGGTSKELAVPKGGSVLKLMEAFTRSDGTDIPSAVRHHFKGHDRIVVVTDEQTRPGWFPSNMLSYGGMRETAIDDLVPSNVPVYMWNMAGYKHGAMPSGSKNRHTFGGLTDQAFKLIPLLEAGRNADWPF